MVGEPVSKRDAPVSDEFRSTSWLRDRRPFFRPEVMKERQFDIPFDVSYAIKSGVVSGAIVNLWLVIEVDVGSIIAYGHAVVVAVGAEDDRFVEAKGLLIRREYFDAVEDGVLS